MGCCRNQLVLPPVSTGAFGSKRTSITSPSKFPSLQPSTRPPEHSTRGSHQACRASVRRSRAPPNKNGRFQAAVVLTRRPRPALGIPSPQPPQGSGSLLGSGSSRAGGRRARALSKTRCARRDGGRRRWPRPGCRGGPAGPSSCGHNPRREVRHVGCRERGSTKISSHSSV